MCGDKRRDRPSDDDSHSDDQRQGPRPGVCGEFLTQKVHREACPNQPDHPAERQSQDGFPDDLAEDETKVRAESHSERELAAALPCGQSRNRKSRCQQQCEHHASPRECMRGGEPRAAQRSLDDG